jgi:hypothetical protein
MLHPTWIYSVLSTTYMLKHLFFQWSNSPYWARASSLLRLHDHTQTHHTRWHSSGRGMSPTQKLPDNTNTHKRQASMRSALFEPTIPASERPQTHAFDPAATEIGVWNVTIIFSNNSSVIFAVRYADSYSKMVTMTCAFLHISEKWEQWYGIVSRGIHSYL